MEKHAIPQNIMDIEFKLFGSMTVKQFGTVAISFVLAFLIYVLGLPEIVSYPIIFITVVTGLAMAFVKVNGMPFTTYFNNFLTNLMTSQRRVYRKTSSSEKASGENVPAPVRQSIVEPKMIKRVARPDLTGFEQQKGQLDSQLEDPLAENKVQSLDAYFSGEAAKSLGKYGIADALAKPAAVSSVPSPSQPELTPPRVPGNFQASVGPSTTSSAAISPKETVTASGLKIVQKGAQLTGAVQSTTPQLITPQSVTEILKPAAPLVQPIIPTIAPEVIPPAVEDDTEQKERVQDLMSAASIDPAATAPTTTLKPNQVAGVITDGASQPLAQVQVIVKDKPGNLLRAAYTDTKGKFLISSALPNGSYELEFIKIGYTFLAHQLELTGTQYPIYKYTAQT